MIFAICKPFPFGWFVANYAVGDGGIGIYSKNDEVKVLNRPDGGEFAGQTRFITMPDIWQTGDEILDRIHFDIVKDPTAVISMTDGVSDPKFETDNNFFNTDKWHDLWNDLSEEVELTKENEKADDQLLDWLDFWSRGNHDDRTIAILLP